MRRGKTGRLLIIPAAGLGSRLGNPLPKLLVPVNGRPMFAWLLDLYQAAVDRTIVIVHPSFADQVRAYGVATGVPLGYEIQETPTGMLDAILLARTAVETSDPARILITWCDQVAIRPETVGELTALSDMHEGVPLILPTTRRASPYIHFERNDEGRIIRVLHRREGDHLPASGESDAGLFSLSRDAFLNLLPEFAASADAGGGTGERNFLPFIPWVAAAHDVLTMPCIDEMEAVGVNTPEDLRAVERYLAERSPR